MEPSSHKPLARTEGLVVQEMDGELLVYDMTTGKGHSLNPTSASVWKACDGSRTVGGLSALFDTHAGADHGEPVVLLALEQLQENRLLQDAVPLGPVLSRRDVVRKIGLTSLIALPMVATLAMPNSAMAQASAVCGCNTPGDCLVQTSCPSTSNCNGAKRCAP